MQISPSRFGNWLMWPVGCPAMEEGSKKLVNKHVHEWSRNNRDLFKGASYGSYLFGGLTIASIFGFIKSFSTESKLLKWSLGILSGIGIATTSFFYECCYGSKHLNYLYNTFLTAFTS